MSLATQSFHQTPGRGEGEADGHSNSTGRNEGSELRGGCGRINSETRADDDRHERNDGDGIEERFVSNRVLALPPMVRHGP